MESLLQIDNRIFEWINIGLSNPIFDFVLPVLRSKSTWIPLYIVIIGFLIFQYRRQFWKPLLWILLTVGISDTISSRIIKPSIERPRPCHLVESHPHFEIRVRCGSGYSFTSSHATNHFALAIIFTFFLATGANKYIHLIFLTWAAAIAFSQIYVGVHYPMDVIFGALLGTLIGYIMTILYKRYLTFSGVIA